MDTKDLKQLSKKDSPGWMASVIVHIGLIIMMMVIYVPLPETINPIQIIMSPGEDDNIIADNEPFVNQQMVDWFAEIEAQQEDEKLAETILEPDFKPADISPIEDPIFNPEPQNGSMSLAEVNPTDLMGNITTDKAGSNSDSEDMGNPLTGTQMDGGTGGDGSFVSPTFAGCNGTPGPVGSTRYFAGGGAGGYPVGRPSGIAGGAGGGGFGGEGAVGAGAGATNTGGGGGGTAQGCQGKAGGSGIVIIRYKFQ